MGRVCQRPQESAHSQGGARLRRSRLRTVHRLACRARRSHCRSKNLREGEFSLAQTHDWMNEIYPMWVAAHGVMIVTPVHWFHGSSPLKLMMDRMVCADGRNPDVTSTHGKDARQPRSSSSPAGSTADHYKGACFLSSCTVMPNERREHVVPSATGSPRLG
jgi:multimeric flavodoxin WrbA